ncbi:hypothetical protein J6590_064944 [Homalodisca vitripennis]|nr:hypothetical protein J6590_064944 [Homalodisca vitripennis]
MSGRGKSAELSTKESMTFSDEQINDFTDARGLEARRPLRLAGPDPGQPARPGLSGPSRLLGCRLGQSARAGPGNSQWAGVHLIVYILTEHKWPVRRSWRVSICLRVFRPQKGRAGLGFTGPVALGGCPFDCVYFGFTKRPYRDGLGWAGRNGRRA